MARLFGFLVTIASLSLVACSSGVSESAGGGSGTTTGGTDLIANASLSTENISIDAFPTDTNDDGKITAEDQLLSTDFGTLSITITDPLGNFSRVFQQVNFHTFEIRYIEGTERAPDLGLRRVSDNLSITLTDGTGSGEVDLPIVDLPTKRQFADQASGSTVFNYTVEVRAIGSDIVTASRIIVVARTQIELGDFVQE